MPKDQESEYTDIFPEEILAKLTLYTEKLKSWNKKFSFTSIPDDNIFDLLVAPSAWLGMRFSKENIGLIADYGTGPGIPGIPMALADRNNKYLLVDSNEKKIGFLRYCLTNKMLIETDKVEAELIRVQPGIWTRKVDRVVTRATGEISELIRLWKGKVSEGANIYLFKGEEALSELEDFAERNVKSKVEVMEVPEWFGNLKIIRICSMPG